MTTFVRIVNIIGLANFVRLYVQASARLRASNIILPEGFSRTDLVLVYLYTHQTLDTYHYKSINAVLRGITHPKARSIRLLAGYMSAALLKLPTYLGPCVRFANLSATQCARYAVGATVQEATFLSSSADLALFWPMSVRYTIASKTGRDISSISRFPMEKEVLFPPNCSFLVLHTSTARGITEIVMEEV